MRPGVRSRLSAAVTAFVGGFALANVGVLVITGPDRWVWVVTALVLMATGATGVLVADTRRPLSLWAVLGVELLVVLTVVPLLWLLSLATATTEEVPRTLWPSAPDWSAFGDVLGAGELRTAMLTSLLVAGLATVLAMALAVPAAYALVRRVVPGRRHLYGVFAAALLVPLVALAGPTSTQLLALGVTDSRLALVPTTLVLAVPLALWLSVTTMLHAPWHLRDAVRADGATRVQELRTFVLPALVPALLLVAALVLVVTAGDAVVGAALAPTPDARTLPASLLLTAGSADVHDPRVAAAGLLWLVPAVVVLAAAPRRIAHLIGRTYR